MAEHAPKSREFVAPLHLIRCIGELAVMYAQEKVRDIKAMLDDDAWPDDSPEDQAIHSTVFLTDSRHDAEGAA